GVRVGKNFSDRAEAGGAPAGVHGDIKGFVVLYAGPAVAAYKLESSHAGGRRDVEIHGAGKLAVDVHHVACIAEDAPAHGTLEREGALLYGRQLESAAEHHGG